MGLRCKETWSGEAGYLSRMRKHVSPAPVARKHGQKFLIALVIVLAGTHRLDKIRKYTVSIFAFQQSVQLTKDKFLVRDSNICESETIVVI